MNALKQSSSIFVRVIWLAVALARFTSLYYVLMAFNLLDVGDLQMDEITVPKVPKLRNV